MPHERVLNRRLRSARGRGVYVGRPTKWGNPVKLHKDDRLHRVACLRAYACYLDGRPQLVEEARAELAGRELVCWCAPKLCHADVLARVVDGMTPAEAVEDAIGRG